MIVEVQGAWLRNLGAALMMRTVASVIEEQRPDWSLALNACWGRRRSRRSAAWTVAPRGGRAEPLLAPIHRGAIRLSERGTTAALRATGRIGPGEADALIDISGFAISDQWDARKVDDRVSAMERYAGQNKPVVVMPQAFGPLSTTAARSAARRLLDATDLVYARDRCSLAALEEVAGARTVRLGPDLTFASPTGPRPTRSLAGRVALVPNERLCDQGGMSATTYLAALKSCGGSIRHAGFEPVIVVHSHDRGDRVLADELAADLRCGEPLRDDDPVALKALLGTARAVIGSRFHALLGALSQGVPCIGIGWSHKYTELMADMGQPEWLIGPDEAAENLAVQTSELLQSDRLDEIALELRTRASQRSAELEQVWQTTLATIERT